MNPVLFQFGPFQLNWYGVFIVGGAVLAAWVSSLYAKRSGENPDHIWNILAWALVVGIIGARLYHVFSNPADGLGWPYYREHPGDIFNFWNGGFRGLGIYGGIAGGLLAIAGYCWFNKLSFIQYLDFIGPNVLLAQAMGRMGNFVNQELYGPATNLPWAFHINPQYPCQIPPNLPEGIQYCGSANLTQQSIDWYATHGFHPTFFYEALWSLAAWAVLALIIRYFGYRLRRGDGALLYLIAYPLGRLWVELFRPDAWVMGQLATAQWVSIITIIFAVTIFILRHIKWDWRKDQEHSLVKMGVRTGPA
jgi:phosphatidylglycerol:prolipoprotein diacylglycerol transferase